MGVFGSWVLKRGTGQAAPNSKLSARIIDTRHHRPTFKFRALGSATGFQCALVQLRAPQGVETAVLPLQLGEELQTARVGQYEFYVRAFNTGGVDLTPATTTFKL